VGINRKGPPVVGNGLRLSEERMAEDQGGWRGEERRVEDSPRDKNKFLDRLVGVGIGIGVVEHYEASECQPS